MFGFLLLRTVVASSSCVWAPSPFCLSLPIVPTEAFPDGPAPPWPPPPPPCHVADCDWSRSLSSLVSPRGRGPISSRLCSGPRPGLAPPPAPGLRESSGWRSSSLSLRFSRPPCPDALSPVSYCSWFVHLLRPQSGHLMTHLLSYVASDPHSSGSWPCRVTVHCGPIICSCRRGGIGAGVVAGVGQGCVGMESGGRRLWG